MYVVKVGNLWFYDYRVFINGPKRVVLIANWMRAKVYDNYESAEAVANKLGGRVMLLTEPKKELKASE
ncbi:hypothetical protein [Loigolactobacillus rennini]|uniref:Uncharacterized protein n=1 Tax=Loigolactobacillus rennini DSM 20253 TaxID=1423796 RepID=A0A0R2CSS4_9LACO|nr:hypothetical protein [Loigolactobacillus rennini]KRM94829.1 hypothetical protein FC24_GL000120 [Loigolactobacillus rennini DSM 20253]